MARITPFNVGYCNHLACVAFRDGGLRRHLFPAQAFLIETRSGPFLWDTGYGRHFAESCRGVFRLAGWLAPARYDEERDALVGQLREAGVGAPEVRGILLSHLHPDHMAAVRDFPGVPLFASAEGIEVVRGRAGLEALSIGYMPALMPEDAEARLRLVETLPTVALPAELAPFSEAWDVTGGGEILVVHLRGHAPGHLGAFVREDDGWTLIASDAAWTREAYRGEPGPPGLTLKLQLNAVEYLRTLQTLARLERQGVRVLLTHEH